MNKIIAKCSVYVKVTIRYSLEDFLNVLKRWGYFIIVVISNPPVPPDKKSLPKSGSPTKNEENYEKALIKFSEDRSSILFSILSLILSIISLIISIRK